MSQMTNAVDKLERITLIAISIFFGLGHVPLLQADSLVPYVTGGISDNFPTDGIGDVIDSSLFIANHTSGQYRAFVEFDVSSIPDGTVLSASLSGLVGPNNSVDVGLREHLVEVYTGNGVIDLSDYSVPGIEVGRFSHPSGDSTNFDLDFTGVLHNLLSAGADYIGMRISPLTDPLPWDVLHGSMSPTPPRLNFEIFPDGAQIDQILPFFDVRVSSDNGPYVLEEGDFSIGVQQVDFAGIDRRGVLEYDISSIPSNADITDAKITFDINGFSGSPGDPAEAIMYGYSGDGIASISDAFETATEIGILGPVDSTDPITVDVDHEFIESLLGGTDFFGLTILGDPDYNSVSFAALEFGDPPFFIPPAQLSLTYTVPPVPGDFDADGDIDEVDFATWEESYGLDNGADSDGDNDSDGLDFLNWQKNFTGPQPLVAAIAVPEPSTAMSFVMAAAFLLLTRQRKLLLSC